MSGALTMEDADHIHMVNTDLDFQPKSADTGAGWDANVDRFLDIESMSPKLVANDGTETNDHGDPSASTLTLMTATLGKTDSRSATATAKLSRFLAALVLKSSLAKTKPTAALHPTLPTLV